MKANFFSIGTKEGLPNNQIQRISIDFYGRIWLAGPLGLMCYDGSRVKIYDTRDGLACSGLRTVLATQSEQLWIGTDQGLESMLIDGTKVPLKLQFEWNYGIAESFYLEESFLWVGTSHGLLLLEQKDQELHLAKEFDIGLVRQIIKYDEQHLLVLSTGKGLIKLNKEEVHLPFDEALPISCSILSIFRTIDFNFLIGTTEGLFLLDKDAKILSRHLLKEGVQKVTAIAAMGNTYIAAFYDRLIIFKQSAIGIKVLEEIAVGAMINDLCTDIFNNIWIGTNNAGLKQLPNFRKAITKIDTGFDSEVFSIRMNKSANKLFVGGANYFSILSKDKKKLQLINSFKIPTIVWDTIQDPNDKLLIWLATQDGLFKCVNNTIPKKDVDFAEQIKNPCRVFLSRNNEIWLGTISGLFVIINGQISEVLNGDGHKFGYVYSMGMTPKRQIWIGTLGQGLWFETVDGFRNIFDQNLSPKGNTYAIVSHSTNGLTAVNQQENIIIIDEQLNSSIVFSDYPIGGWTLDWIDSNTLGVGSSKGVCIIDVKAKKLKHRLNLYLDKSEWQFTCSKSMFAFSKNELYCGLYSGVYQLDVTKVEQFAIYPKVFLNACKWMNVQPSFDNGTYRLETGKWAMEVSVFSPWFVDVSQLSFRFKLAGFDEDWQPLETTAGIKFNSLPVGNYEFFAQVYTPLTGFGTPTSLFKISVRQSLHSVMHYLGLKASAFLGWLKRPNNKNKRLLQENELFKSEIEERRKVEDELTNYKNQLEDIVEQRTSDLIAEKEKAESADKLKTIFVATMSHEIRTPLGGIIGLNALLKETSLDKIQQEYVEKIDHSAAHLLQIINNILDITKIEAGQLDLEVESFSLNKLVEDVCEFAQIKLDNPSVDIVVEQETDFDLHVMGDFLRIKQVLFNLIGNAIKFTEAGTIVFALKQLSSISSKTALRFSISDSGIGITEKQMESLFGAFKQADSSITRKYGGSGLGLNISYNYVKLMNSQLSVTSKIGEGTSFFFTLMLNPVKPKLSTKQPVDQINYKKALLIGNNDHSLRVLSLYLKDMGIEVAQSRDLPNAYTLCEDQEFDLVLIDWLKEDLLKEASLKKLKASLKNPQNAQVILLSGEAKDLLLIDSSSLDIQDVLLKPISKQKLYRSIATLNSEEQLKLQTKEIIQPILVKEKKEPVQEKPVNHLNQKHRILVAEDNEINQLILETRLVQRGYDVTITNNGKECIERLEQDDNFDIIFMDKQMPEMDGLTATKYIRETLKNDTILIVALTADVTIETQSEFRKYGFNGYLPKPLVTKDLFACIDKLLE